MRRYAEFHKEWASELGISHNELSTHTLELYKGWNFVGLPVKPREGYTFLDLLLDTQAEFISYFSNLKYGWLAVHQNTPYTAPVNIKIREDMAFFIMCNEDREFSFEGKIYNGDIYMPSQNSNLKNIECPIHFPYTPLTYTTIEDLLLSTKAKKIYTADNKNQQWTQMDNNYEIKKGDCFILQY